MLNRFYITLSLAIRTSISLFVLMLLARTLGPRQFGLVATTFAYATIASLVTDFGFSIKTLRDIAANPADGSNLLGGSLCVKILLSSAVALVGTVCVLLVPTDAATKLSCLMLGGGVIIAAIGDLALTSFRAIGQYKREMTITLQTSAIYGISVGSLCWVNSDLIWIGLAFLVSRTLYSITAVRHALKLFPGSAITAQSLREVPAAMNGAWAWAVDSGFSYINSQVDALIVAQLFGLTAAGIYLSGARLVQSSLALLSVLAAVHVPALAALGPQSRLSPLERRAIVEFCSLGALLAIGFLVGGPLVTRFALGSQYLPANALWPGFAAFLFAKCAAAGLGYILSAYGFVKLRVGGQLMTTTTLFVCLLAIPSLTVITLPWIMCASTTVTGIFYLVCVICKTKEMVRKWA